MPHSPFTRLLGAFIVACYFLALLWPDERAHLWDWPSLRCYSVISPGGRYAVRRRGTTARFTGLCPREPVMPSGGCS